MKRLIGKYSQVDANHHRLWQRSSCFRNVCLVLHDFNKRRFRWPPTPPSCLQLDEHLKIITVLLNCDDGWLILDCFRSIMYHLCLSSTQRWHYSDLVSVTQGHQLVVNGNKLPTHCQDHLTLQHRESTHTEPGTVLFWSSLHESFNDEEKWRH